MIVDVSVEGLKEQKKKKKWQIKGFLTARHGPSAVLALHVVYFFFRFVGELNQTSTRPYSQCTKIWFYQRS